MNTVQNSCWLMIVRTIFWIVRIKFLESLLTTKYSGMTLRLWNTAFLQPRRCCRTQPGKKTLPGLGSRLHLVLDLVFPGLDFLAMQVSMRQVGDKCITLYNQAAQSTQSTQTLVGEHTRNASPETEAKSCGPGM